MLVGRGMMFAYLALRQRPFEIWLTRNARFHTAWGGGSFDSDDLVWNFAGVIVISDEVG